MCGKQAEMFKVLGVESRIKIIELLKERGPLCVSEIAETLDVTPSAVSQHLKVLKHAGLVRSERKGYWIPYQIDAGALECCQEFLGEVCRCDCKARGLDAGAGGRGAEDELRLLKKHKRELEEKLEKVRARIEQLGEEA